MACWSSKNATRAYLQALKMGERGKVPDIAEFISALAAGNNAQFMVMACSSVAVSTVLALVAAAHQTGGRVVCILHGLDTIDSSKKALGLGPYANFIEFVAGDAQDLLNNEYKGADFMLIDCNIDDYKGIFTVAQDQSRMHEGGVIVGYNALCKGSWSECNTHFLPIGNGLLVTKTTASQKVGSGDGDVVKERKRSRWVVTIDKCTGEEHVFRITSSHQKVIQA